MKCSRQACKVLEYYVAVSVQNTMERGDNGFGIVGFWVLLQFLGFITVENSQFLGFITVFCVITVTEY